MNRLVVDSYSHISPFLVFKRFEINDLLPKTFLYTFDTGFSYLLKDFYGKYSEKEFLGRDPFLLNAFIDFTRTARNRKLQSLPIPFNLITQPNGNDVVYLGSPLPADNLAFNVSSNAHVYTEPIKIDFLYMFRETLQYTIHLQCGVVPQNKYLDVLLNGYLVPDDMLNMWG